MSRNIITRKLCLNCKKKAIGNYCIECGQKTNTERLSIKNFMTSEFLKGVLNLNKGFLFTLKEVCINPGKVANEYILGKRIKYYNIFYLTIIIITAILILRGLKSTELVTSESDAYLNGKNVVKNNYKLIILLFIPYITIVSKIIYRKTKLNIAEHAIIAGICVCNLALFLLLVNITNNIFNFFEISFNEFSKIFFTPILILVGTRVYYLAFKEYYEKKRKNLINAILTIIVFIIIYAITVIPVLDFINKSG